MGMVLQVLIARVNIPVVSIGSFAGPAAVEASSPRPAWPQVTTAPPTVSVQGRPI